MTNYALFFLVILLANIIQGITGFAGTILAMPPSLMLVGYPVAKPVLNVLGLLSGIYVFAGHRKAVNWTELKKIVAVMAVGILGGILIKGMFVGKEEILYKLLGIFVIILAIQGGITLRREGRPGDAAGTGGTESPDAAAGHKDRETGAISRASAKDSPALVALLGLAGVVHGIFVSGGPLLISYLTKKIKDKVSFRATISTVWIFLNTLILLDDVRAGFWTTELFIIQLISLPFLLAGMYIGSKLYVRMSQRLFMTITYVLLFISGISLLVK